MKFATIFKEDLEYISRCILDYPDIETGGDFFGFWNNLGFPVIQYVTGKGINSYQATTFFKQDIDYLLKVSNAAYQSFGLQHIGSWHSHHQLGLAVPSGHDCQTMAKAINNNGLNQFFMILGNVKGDSSTVNGFLFDKENQCKYSETQWNILCEKNTFKEIIDKFVGKDLYLPQTAKAKFANLRLINNVKTETIVLDSKPENELEVPVDCTNEQPEEKTQVILPSANSESLGSETKTDIEVSEKGDMECPKSNPEKAPHVKFCQKCGQKIIESSADNTTNILVNIKSTIKNYIKNQNI